MPKKKNPEIRLCEVEGCGKKHLALGFCRSHYNQFKMQAEHRTCSIDGCERPLYARGYCASHYRALIETREIPLIYKRQSPTCSVDGCDGESAAHGLCNKHWFRWKKYGDVDFLKVSSWKDGPKNCKYPGCTMKVHKNGTCRKHAYYYTKIEVINHYGGKCACCGENRIEFLCLDHVNNDGYKHKRNGHRFGGYTLYDYLVRNNFETEFELQVLCHNCNAAKAGYGYCPHQKEVEHE